MDATSGIAGPLCGKLLADAGAVVTRLDPPGVAPAPAHWPEFLSRGKHVLPLDVTLPAHRERLDHWLGRAALYLCSARHHELAPFALDCHSVLDRHPHLVSACITGFGQSGPYASFRADDLVLSALCGLADCTPGFPDRQELDGEPPVQSRAPLAEVGAGVVATAAVLGALTQRLRGAGEPQHVEISAHEANVWLMVSEWGIAAYGRSAPGRRRKSRSLEPNCYLPCRDGYVVVVATTDRHWRALVEAIGSPAWAADPRFRDVAGRAANVEALHGRLRDWARGVNGAEFMERAQARGIPCTCYRELSEAVSADQVRALGSIDTSAGRPFPSDPIVVDGQRRTPPRAALTAAPLDPAAGAAPLAGVRVLDLGQMVAGPMAGQVLAALGAAVTVVESRVRLTSRSFAPFAGEPAYDASSNFNHCNRGKDSVEVDLTTAEGRQVLRQLVSSCDVVLENFSRHAAERLGVRYADLAEVRDDVILASISAFGRRGPHGGYVSHHGGVTALSGLAGLIRDERGEPRLVGAIYPDVLSGTYMAIAIQQALAAREQTGSGCHLELSMLDVLFTCMAGLIPDAGSEALKEPHPGRFLPTAEPHRFLAVAAEDCEADPGLVARVARRTRSDAMAELQASGIRAAAVLDMLEVIEDPHLGERGFVVELDHPVAGRKPLPGVPWLYDGRRPPLGVAPLLGNRTQVALEELQWTA